MRERGRDNNHEQVQKRSGGLCRSGHHDSEDVKPAPRHYSVEPACLSMLVRANARSTTLPSSYSVLSRGLWHAGREAEYEGRSSTECCIQIRSTLGRHCRRRLCRDNAEGVELELELAMARGYSSILLLAPSRRLSANDEAGGEAYLSPPRALRPGGYFYAVGCAPPSPGNHPAPSRYRPPSLT